MSLAADEQKRVLAAAARLGGQDGGYTMDQLARTAGMSRATLYRRFGGRARLDAALRERGAAPQSLRERLLAATFELVGERGPLGFSLEDVAVRAGASVTTIYRVFGERDELIREAIARLAPHASLRPLVADHDAPIVDTLEAFVAAAIARFESQPIFLRILFNPDPDSWRYLHRIREHEVRLSRVMHEYFAAQIERGRVGGAPPRRLATALVGMILGDVLMHRMSSDPRPPAAERARVIVALFLAGAGRRGRRRA